MQTILDRLKASLSHTRVGAHPVTAKNHTNAKSANNSTNTQKDEKNGDAPLFFDNLPEPIFVKRHPRARRISLRLDQKKRQIILTLPQRMSLSRAEPFIRDHRSWILKQLNNLPEHTVFAHGVTFPLLGKDYTILHDPSRLRGLPKLCDTDKTLTITGHAEHLPRKVTDFLKKQAKAHITPKAEEKARIIGKSIKSIAVKDTKSRWGSCTSDRALSFSWRLILAPPNVIDYVIAHEVAHLQHLDHSPNFWAVCDDLSCDMDFGKNWLKKNGSDLYQYGT